MEMVRRAEPSAGQPDPWWGQGNPSEPESVSNEETTSTVAEPALAEAHTKRGRSREETTKQINEYAYWCIENSMWDEARLHLERAVSQDSMSASLFNNLGVIYERQGETDHADSAYARATALLPESQAYAANLRRLRERAEAAARVFIDSAAAEASTSADATGSAAGTAQDSSE
jgi:Flp pilus assembly protein TadD